MGILTKSLRSVATWIGITLPLLFPSLGCGSRSEGVGGLHQIYGNYHPAGWVSLQPKVPGNHATQAVASLETCLKCHQLTIQAVNSAIPGCLTSGCHHSSRPGWVNADPASGGEHGEMAKLAKTLGGGLAGCQVCHGNPADTTGAFFSGGVSGKGCFTCHAPSSGVPVAAPHPPKPWRIGAGSILSHATTDPSNAPICAQCHYAGSPSNPPNHPATPAPAATPPGCFNSTLCHGNNAAPHAVPFLAGQIDAQQNGHLTVTATAFAADCANCHAYSGTAPVSGAPLCSVCHSVADPTRTGSEAGTCLSCHVGSPGLPVGPSSTGFPNIAGAHAKHMTLGTTLSCEACHAGSGSGSLTHYSNANARIGTPVGPAPVSIDPIFKAKTGGDPSFSAASLTCANVSCHGGQTTPGWQNGTLTKNATTYCLACHKVASTPTQYNDATGRHANPGEHQVACSYCHDMTQAKPGAQNHFKYLDSQAVSGVSGSPADQYPSDTIKFDATKVFPNGTGPSYTPSPQGAGYCTLTCHSGGEQHDSGRHWN